MDPQFKINVDVKIVPFGTFGTQFSVAVPSVSDAVSEDERIVPATTLADLVLSSRPVPAPLPE
jgi:uncharacterized protein YqgV (UPF0045/DUF77 family)